MAARRELRERISRIVLDDLQKANDFYRESVEPKLLERRNIYFSSHDYYRKKFPQLSEKTDYRSFDFYAYVQWAKPAVMTNFYGSANIVSIAGQGPEDEPAAEIMNKLVNWQFTQQCRAFPVFDGWIEDAIVYESGILKCWWNRNTEVSEATEVFPLEHLMQMLTDDSVEVTNVEGPDFFGDYTVTYKKQSVLENRPVLDNVSPFDMRWERDARTMADANFVAQRQLVTVDAIRRGIRDGIYDRAEAEEAIEKAGAPDYTTADYEQNKDLLAAEGESEEARGPVELYECYVNLAPDEKGLMKPFIVTVASGVVIRAVPNTLGRLPFFHLSVHRDPAKVLPEMSMAVIEGELQDLRTAIVRQMLVNLSLSNKARKFVDATTVNIDDLLRDRQYVRVNGPPGQAIMPEPPMQIAGWTMNLVEYLKSVEEEWSGKTRFNQGMDASSLNHTATGITAIMDAASKRINYIIQGFAEGGFTELNQFLIYLNQRYIDDRQMIRVFGRPLEVAPDDLQGNLDITVKTDLGLSEKQQALMLFISQGYQLLASTGACGPHDLAQACFDYLSLSGLKNPERYVHPEEVGQVAQQQILGEAAGGVPGGAAVSGGAGGGMPGVPGQSGGMS